MKLLVASIVLLGFVQLSSSSCGSSRLVADAENAKILTSPNFPSKYNPNLTCSWVISSCYTSLDVQLKFISFNTYGTSGACTNSSDNLEVYNNIDDKSSSKLLGRYCGSNVLKNLTVSSSGKYNYHLYLKFTSSSNETRQGFKLEYMASQDSSCGSFLLNAEIDKPKVLTSPSYPASYPSQTKCSWLITAPQGQYVKLNFTNFDLAGPHYHFGSCNILNHTLKIFDFNQTFFINSHLLGKYCGKSVPANVISSKRYLTLVFSSPLENSNYSTKQAFRLEYSALSSPASYYSMCSTLNSWLDLGFRSVTLKASSSYQYIRSPLYPDKYPSNLYCTWRITASSGTKKIKLEVTDLKISNKVAFLCSDLDALEISGGDSYAEYCDRPDDLRTKTKTVISSGQRMSVVFRTNTDNFFKVNQTAGFEVRFMEIDSNASILQTNVCITVGIILGQFVMQMI